MCYGREYRCNSVRTNLVLTCTFRQDSDYLIYHRKRKISPPMFSRSLSTNKKHKTVGKHVFFGLFWLYQVIFESKQNTKIRNLWYSYAPSYACTARKRKRDRYKDATMEELAAKETTHARFVEAKEIRSQIGGSNYHIEQCDTKMKSYNPTLHGVRMQSCYKKLT